MLKLDKEHLLTIFLVFAIALLILNKSSVAKEPDILFDKSTNTIYLDSLTLRQKIAQMIVTYEDESNKEALQHMLIGGIHMGAKPTKADFIDAIDSFQENAVIPFFITVDMEGCWNPFEQFQDFPSLSELETKEQAYEAGYEEGRMLKELGFSINLAPIVDLEDNIWNCRSFKGTPMEISAKANAYIAGLQQNSIIATSKHYPGKTLLAKDPHKSVVGASIDSNDLLPFDKTIENGVKAILVSHLIVNGSVSSGSKPSVVSEKLVANLRTKFTGLIITDEIRMSGLKDYYSDTSQMYIDLFKAENDLILNFDTNPRNLQRMITMVENAVKIGEISEERIDRSVTKILNAKGINVK